jgi:hypothetical protein
MSRTPTRLVQDVGHKKRDSSDLAAHARPPMANQDITNYAGAPCGPETVVP